jgi:peroxiredoxin Q/BCP
MMNKISKGSIVPDFQLLDQNGEVFQLNEYLGKFNLVIYFYPKDDTPGCTAEACSFRDQYEEFADLGAKVIGISSDTIGSHKRFADNHRLSFTLLSDIDGKVRKMFGVPSDLFGFLPGRVTYVIDKQGRVKHIFNSQFNAKKHVKEALRILKKQD